MGDRSVTMFAADGAGRRQSSFHLNGIKVSVSPEVDGDRNEEAFQMACRLSMADVRIATLERQLAEAKAQIVDQNRRPARLLGTGYVRFCNGELWILNRRERGFGEFGYRCDDWDDLFRRFNVHVSDHGEDEHGPWWAVENKPEAAQ